jgi:plastocyanin
MLWRKGREGVGRTYPFVCGFHEMMTGTVVVG